MISTNRNTFRVGSIWLNNNYEVIQLKRTKLLNWYSLRRNSDISICCNINGTVYLFGYLLSKPIHPDPDILLFDSVLIPMADIESKLD